MFTEEELDDLRELQEDFFNCKMRITAQNRASRDDVDPDTLQITASEQTLYDGPGFFQSTTRNYEQSAEIGEAKQTVRTYNCRIRWDMDDLRVNDVVEIYDSHDPMVEGKSMIVLDPQIDSNATVRYFIAALNLEH